MVNGPDDVYVERTGPIEKVSWSGWARSRNRNGLTAGFSQVLASAPRRRHDPGVTLVQLLSSRR
jgi:hypothetical protein